MENEKQRELAEKQQEIINLTNDLTSPASEIGDYRVIKCYEAALSGQKTMPYDVKDLIAKRQEVRDKINALEAEVGKLEAANAQ